MNTLLLLQFKVSRFKKAIRAWVASGCWTGVGLSFAVFAALLSLVSLEGIALLAPETANAVVGRPLTPVSAAGVARRTVRRDVAATSVAAGAVVATGAVATAAALTTLPAGCSTLNSGGYTYHHCGSVYYQPVYDGPNVTYVQVERP